jgi:D-3-phosphoglycerate dehydrogenase
MALIFERERKIVLYNNAARNGEWNAALGYPVHRFSHLTIGLVGLATSEEVAKYAKAFGSTSWRTTVLPQSVFDEKEVEKMELDELLKIADIVSVHVPLNSETKHLINKDKIALMKDGVI